MDTPSTPSGLRVRHIKTKMIVVDGEPTIVPELDAAGQEIEIYSVDVPQAIEHEGGDAIETHVLEQLTAPATRRPDPAGAPVVAEGSPAAPTLDEGGE